MSRNNHLFIGGTTDLSELEQCIDKHGDSISYLKIGSACVEDVNVKAICSMVKWSAIFVCLGGGVLEDTRKVWKTKRLLWRRFSPIKKLIKQGVNAIEIPSHVLDDKEITDFTRDNFSRRLVEVGVKADCMHPLNSPTRMSEWIKLAEEHKTDHIVLEASLSGQVGIYHTGSRTPNILLVDQLQEQIANNLRCIIESPYFREQNLWRTVYGPDAHIGNIDDFENVGKPLDNQYPEEYWTHLRAFRKRLEKLCRDNDISWDEVARNEEINLYVIQGLHELVSFSDEELLAIIHRYIFDDPFAMIRMLMGSSWLRGEGMRLPTSMIRLGGGVIFMGSFGWGRDDE